MFNFRKLYASLTKSKPSLWLRYIDDVFLLWTHGPEEFQNFLDHCNNFHHSIKFTAETSSLEIPFLDVMVSIKDGSLHTHLYSKPTDSHQFLHWTSCHPKHTKSSLPYGLAFRLNRICSTPATLNTRVTELKGFLKARGYPSGTVERQINKALAIPRSEALKPTNTDSDTRLDRVPMVITYHPSLPKLTQIIHKYLPILHSSDVCRKAIPKPPMVAYRRSANIKDLVVRSTLPPLQPPPRGSFACGQCKSCSHKQHPREVSHTAENATFTSTSTGDTYTIRKHLSCQTENVVYLITCTACDKQYVGETKRACDKQYVGETKRSLECRLVEHCADARNNRNTPVARHFNLPNHGAHNIAITCIDKPPKNDTLMRKNLEKEWIKKLNTTQPHGINMKD